MDRPIKQQSCPTGSQNYATPKPLGRVFFHRIPDFEPRRKRFTRYDRQSLEVRLQMWQLDGFNCPKAELEASQLRPKVSSREFHTALEFPQFWVTTLKAPHTRAMRPATVAAGATVLVLFFIVAGVFISNRPQQPEVNAWSFTSSSASALDLSFVSIPEPGAWISLIGGGAVLVGIQRFRRRG